MLPSIGEQINELSSGYTTTIIKIIQYHTDTAVLHGFTMHTSRYAKCCLKSGCGRGVASGPGELATILMNNRGTYTHASL